ncbi:hypothetical protein ACFW1A_08975 [Kitasatospora sp. NPDC058965]|uniref:hypothetical protein n=1 Tax=Kitasatospora sp. NPDC058965 TaxID=3346682 RepID=UPI0036CA9714
MDRRTQPRTTAPRTTAPRSRRTLAAGAALSVAAGALALAGCSSSAKSTATSVASSAVSAAQSALSSIGSQAASQASSAISAGASEAASAASSAFASATAGLDATADVTLGTVSTTSDGKAQVPVTVKNSQSTDQRYTIEVDFKDQSGSTQDVVVLNPGPVAAGQTANATAVSNRTLSGTVVANVARAVRY